MSADKNHEKYLEEIETAVAETTKALMENEDYNLREAYRKIAEQDVEIKRLKEYQSSDRKTIRNLRKQLAEATEENEKLKEELDIWVNPKGQVVMNKEAMMLYEASQEENKKLNQEVNDRVVIEDIAELFGSDEGDDFDWESEIGGMIEENKKLKENKEDLEATIKMMKDNIKECKSGTDGGMYGLVPQELYTKATEEIALLKQAEKNQIKYWEGCIRNANEQIEKLKKETWNKTQVDEIVGNAIDRIEQDCDAYWQENKRLKKELEKYTKSV